MDSRQRLDRGRLGTLDRGTVVLVDLDPTFGHEQRGLRPAVIVSDPLVVEDQRFSLVGDGEPAHETRLREQTSWFFRRRDSAVDRKSSASG